MKMHFYRIFIYFKAKDRILAELSNYSKRIAESGFVEPCQCCYHHNDKCAGNASKLAMAMDDNRSLRLELLGRLVRPLVGYCLRNSHSLQELFSVIKQAAVKMAEEEIRKVGKRPNVSRVSVLTGLHRAEVNRLYQADSEEPQEPLNLLARVMSQWRLDRRFSKSEGHPRALSYRGDDSEFKRLVETVSKHINPGTVLFQLVRVGAVAKSKQRVRLLRHLESVQGDPLKGFDLLARDMETLTLTVEENLFSPQKRTNLHLRTEYDNVFFKNLPEIRDWLMDQGKEFHKRAREYLSSFDKDVNPGQEGEPAGARVVLGAFSWTSKPLPPETAAAATKKSQK
jgi:hypothetical protein